MNAAPVYMPCTRCRDARIVWNSVMQRIIRCPQCTTRVPRSDSSGLRQVTAAEARRRKRAVALVVAEAVLGSGVRVARLDPEFITTNRVWERWRVGTGEGLPRTLEDWAEAEEEAVEQDDTFSAPESLPPPLDDVTQSVIDQIYEHSPRHMNKFIREWYCSPLPCMTMARQRGIGHEAIYLELHGVLRYYRQRFERSGHADLIAMVRALP